METFRGTVVFVLGWIAGVFMTFYFQQLPFWSQKASENARRLVQMNSSQLIYVENKEGAELKKYACIEETHTGQDQPRSATFFNNGRPNMHIDDTRVADEHTKKIKILCLVLTHAKNYRTKAAIVNATWGQRCTKLLFVTNEDVPSLPTMVVNVSDGRQFLSEKTRLAFNQASNYIDDYDWFMKADDDTYVIMENLRYFLSEQNSNEALYFGRILRKEELASKLFAHGGAGYVISKEAMKRYKKMSQDVCKFITTAEDVEFARCMALLKVPLRDSLDSLGRTRFHSLNPRLHLEGRHPQWFLKRDIYKGDKQGISGLSEYAISFHYVTPDDILLLEYLLYHLKPYGIIKGLHDLNDNTNTSKKLSKRK